ncbi:acid protease, partial [Hesseltinella vesiculosa]
MQEDSVRSPLTNVDIAYLIDLAIGEPPQPFTLLVDTGSSTTWVPAAGCDELCGNPQHMMNPSLSDSFNATKLLMKIKYGEGFSSGMIAQDTFTVRNTTINQVYFSVSMVNDGELTDVGADGILGLGPDILSKYDNPESLVLPTLVTSMTDQGLIAKNMFSIYFHPPAQAQAPWETRIDGDLVFGGSKCYLTSIARYKQPFFFFSLAVN